MVATCAPALLCSNSTNKRSFNDFFSLILIEYLSCNRSRIIMSKMSHIHDDISIK